jgi:hypothetical protein
MEVTNVQIPYLRRMLQHLIELECFDVKGAAIHASPNLYYNSSIPNNPD